ncbi:DUF4411 family protein [Sedimentisphaera salicampi]|uniref:DUF4411 family protein n=1 Tax=Sedimentisphaera salicampi TaxID=1941349 RepID=UPI000B9ADC9C|nr:DUF4411 family protein [Sedimentisphaera salicampi]OXU15037.1 hypothetical protein SMSP1_01230 [Sedimentisphaera salicampi]
MTYCLDTGVFIEAWTKYYAFDFFPEYWEKLDNLARDGVVFATEEVKNEIEKIDDELKEWLSEKHYFFKRINDEVQNCLIKIYENPTHHRLVDNIKGRSIADPWVIAHAMAEDAVVVTKEGSAPPRTPRIKIPNVCDNLGVECIQDYEMVRRLGIKFRIE